MHAGSLSPNSFSKGMFHKVLVRLSRAENVTCWEPGLTQEENSERPLVPNTVKTKCLEMRGKVKARLQENSGAGPRPSSFSWFQPSQQSDVGYVRSPESHIHPVHGSNSVQVHMGVLRAPASGQWAGNPRRFSHHRVRAHDSTALTWGSKTQGSCLSHTCAVSAVCRLHCICVPTGQALKELWDWPGSWGCSVQNRQYQGQSTAQEVSVSG